MEAWQLILSPKLSGSAHMEFDLGLFNDLEKGSIPSTLRIYSWRPKCISLGYSQDIDGLVDRSRAKNTGWDIVKRPTGGGIVFHNEAEVTYSLVTALDDPLLPGGLVSSYKKLSEAIVHALGLLGVKAGLTRTQNSDHRTQNAVLCFSYPAEYEIVAGGKKIVGSAQKRGKRALLQQGSIFVRNTDKGSFSVLKGPYGRQNAVSVEEILGRKVGFEELSGALVKGFEKGLGIELKT